MLLRSLRAAAQRPAGLGYAPPATCPQLPGPPGCPPHSATQPAVHHVLQALGLRSLVSPRPPAPAAPPCQQPAAAPPAPGPGRTLVPVPARACHVIPERSHARAPPAPPPLQATARPRLSLKGRKGLEYKLRQAQPLEDAAEQAEDVPRARRTAAAREPDLEEHFYGRSEWGASASGRGGSRGGAKSTWDDPLEGTAAPRGRGGVQAEWGKGAGSGRRGSAAREEREEVWAREEEGGRRGRRGRGEGWGEAAEEPWGPRRDARGAGPRPSSRGPRGGGWGAEEEGPESSERLFGRGRGAREEGAWGERPKGRKSWGGGEEERGGGGLFGGREARGRGRKGWEAAGEDGWEGAGGQRGPGRGGRAAQAGPRGASEADGADDDGDAYFSGGRGGGGGRAGRAAQAPESSGRGAGQPGKAGLVGGGRADARAPRGAQGQHEDRPRQHEAREAREDSGYEARERRGDAEDDRTWGSGSAYARASVDQRPRWVQPEVPASLAQLQQQARARGAVGARVGAAAVRGPAWV